MSMIAVTDVAIILFDLLKYGNTSLQEAGHLCMFFDVYSCYQSENNQRQCSAKLNFNYNEKAE